MIKNKLIWIFALLILISFAYATSLSYVTPTDADGTNFIRNYTYINFSSDLWNNNISSFILNWNGTNNTIIDKTLLMSFNFNNNTFNESKNWFYDNSIYGYNATCDTCPLINKTAYMFGRSLWFSGASQEHIRTRGLTSNPSNFTIMLWIRPDFSSTDATSICGGDSCPIIHFGDQANPRLYSRFEPPSILVTDDGTGQLSNVQVYWDGAGTSMTGLNGNLPTYSAGEWHHLAITGLNVNNLANEPIIIGWGDGTHSTSSFKGIMDELRIWNRSLDGIEINRTRFMEIGKFHINQTALKSGNYTYYGYLNATNGVSVTTCTRNYGGSATNDCLEDTTPPRLGEINITSEGGLGQKVNLSDPLCSGVGCTVPKINDSTPTLTANFTESATAGLIDNRTQTYVECTITGAVFNICTESTILPVGLSNITLNWSDSSGNKNQTMFIINITDNIPPEVELSFPLEGVFFIVGINTTNIRFNWSSTDNFDKNYNCTGRIDNIFEFSNGTYANNTEGNFSKTIISAGSHTWNISCADSFNNIGSSQRSFSITNLSINISLNEPKNKTLVYLGINTLFNFTVNFTETIDKCFLFINQIRNQSNYTKITTNIKINLTANLTNNDYNWTIGCNTSTNKQINATDIFVLFVNSKPNASFSLPTLANNSLINNLSILINISTQGKILNYTLEWNGTNESITFNTTLNLLINKTGLNDLTTYTYRVYANDTNGNSNSTEKRIFSTNFFGLIISVTPKVNFTFKSSVEEIKSIMPNETILWAGNDTFRQLIEGRIDNSTINVYNNGTKINNGNNWTANSNGQIKILNSTILFNGTTTEWITNKINVSYKFFSGNFTLRTQNISCSGQNESVGCINASSIFGYNLNLSLIFNITLDPVNQRIIEDFSTSALNWSVFQQRSNNTINKSITNSSVACAEIQSFNSQGLLEYRFNNTLLMLYINSSNQSVLINLTFNCTSPNYFTRILNGSQRNISGFNAFNFSWKGDNTTNTFVISAIDTIGTKASSSSLSLQTTEFNYSGFSISTLGNISIINISITNVSGTNGLSGFFMDNLKLTNTTSNQSSRIKMKAGCTYNYANSTLLIPNILTNMCSIPSGTITKYIWLWQDINLTQKGISWKLQYNTSIIS